MRKTLTLSALAAGLLFVSKGSTQTPTYAPLLPAAPQVYPPPIALLTPVPTTPPQMPTWHAPRTEPAKLITKVFDITEIVLQVGTKGTPEAVEDRAGRLTNLLEGFIEPTSWKCAGGRGSMVFFAENYSLVVNNEPKVVAKVETWIEKLRVPAKPEVKVDIGRIRCDSATLAKLGFAGRKANEPIPLTPAQLAETMKVLETDFRFERLESPMLVLQDNQTGFVQIGQHVATPGMAAPSAIPGQPPVPVPAKFVGISYRATPRVAPDGRTILLRLESEKCNVARCEVVAKAECAEVCGQALAKPVTLPAFDVQTTTLTLAVPNGGTVLVPLGTERVDERIMTKVPVIADLPMFDKFFSHTRTEPRQYETFVLVTANTLSRPTAAVPPMLMPTTQRPDPMPTAMPVVHMLPPVMPTKQAVADFVGAYRKACAEGRMVEARNFALQALAVDPKCFDNK